MMRFTSGGNFVLVLVSRKKGMEEGKKCTCSRRNSMRWHRSVMGYNFPGQVQRGGAIILGFKMKPQAITKID
jgi:hypothetical protein